MYLDPSVFNTSYPADHVLRLCNSREWVLLYCRLSTEVTNNLPSLTVEENTGQSNHKTANSAALLYTARSYFRPSSKSLVAQTFHRISARSDTSSVEIYVIESIMLHIGVYERISTHNRRSISKSQREALILPRAFILETYPLRIKSAAIYVSIQLSSDGIAMLRSKNEVLSLRHTRPPGSVLDVCKYSYLLSYNRGPDIPSSTA